MRALIENYYAAFNAGDRQRMLSLLADEVVHEINEGGTETGREVFRAFLDRMDRCYQERVEDLVIFTSDTAPHRAAAEFHIRGTYLATDPGLPEASGQPYHLRVGAFFEAREGKITRVSNYYNLRAWLGMVS
jgi:steroid delta-isomerase-like uncharacterized protein